MGLTMANRAYITIDSKKTFYVHYNGGFDSILPAMQAVLEFRREHSTLGLAYSDFSNAFKALFSQNLEPVSSENAHLLLEENGHWFIGLNNTYLYNRENKDFELMGLKLNEVRISKYEPMHFKALYDAKQSSFKEGYRDSNGDRFEAIVKEFKDSLLDAHKDRILKEVEMVKINAELAKKSFKKLILDELKESDFSSVVKKIKSIRSKSYSGGSSLDVDAVDLNKKERDYLDSIVKSYQYGSFDSMNDIYVYSEKENRRPKTVKYAFLNVEYSTELKAKMAEDLLEKFDVSDNERAWEVFNCDLNTVIYRMCRNDGEI